MFDAVAAVAVAVASPLNCCRVDVCLGCQTQGTRDGLDVNDEMERERKRERVKRECLPDLVCALMMMTSSKTELIVRVCLSSKIDRIHP